MRLFNYLSREVEEFRPTGDVVGLYTCGPTVYDYVHIGNWRTFVFEDVLKRALVFNGYKVKHVMNLTDIDDKIIKKAQEKKVEIGAFTSKYADAFFDDLAKLNIIRADVYPRATENINSMIQIIEVLLRKGIAYKGDDGIYFSVEKFGDYGKLSGLDRKNLKKGARVSSDEYDKESWTDFALWKFPTSPRLRGKSLQPRSSPGLEPSWNAPFGVGRPGWHIECSAMSIKELGESFDLHTGGVDLLFPHHENEIAQSEAATGKKFVNWWMEGEHLLVDGEKMAKRLGNIFTLRDVTQKGFDPIALRYLFLTAHYRSKLNFTWESLGAAQNALDKIREKVTNEPKEPEEPKVIERFKAAINEDLDMPKAVAVFHEALKAQDKSSVLRMDEVLGFGLSDVKQANLPKEAKELITKREELRKQGQFEESDEIRKQLGEMGVDVEDTIDGTKWTVRIDRASKSKK